MSIYDILCSFFVLWFFMKGYSILIVFSIFLSSSIFAQSERCYRDEGEKGIINVCEKIKSEALTGIIESEYNLSQMYSSG